jgi:membrane protease YdiL (CAAX protease family)
MSVDFLTNRCEFAEPRQYSGKGELLVAVIGCVLWFSAIVVRLSFSQQTWTLTEQLIEATSFVVFAAIPIFFLATRSGSAFVKRVLLRNRGLWFQVFTCLLLGLYITVVKTLALNPARFGWLKEFDSLIIKHYFWANVILFLIGVFIVLRLPFLLLELRNRRVYTQKHQSFSLLTRYNGQLLLLLSLHFIYTSLVNTSLISTAFTSEYSGYWIGLGYFLVVALMHLPIVRTTPPDRMMVFDLLLAVACLVSLFAFSKPFFSFGAFISLTLFVLVWIYGTGLGRAHFGYSFEIRQADLLYVGKAVLAAIFLLVPLALLLNFTQAKPFSAFDWRSIPFVLSYAILFSFRVGIFEEILFRSGLMVFIRDQIQARSHQPLNRQQLVLWSAIICSVIFGLCHIGNHPGSGSALSPLQYKAIYATLATLASMFYALAFGETNRLWASITIHGVVDTTAVLLLGASLVVPF